MAFRLPFRAIRQASRAVADAPGVRDLRRFWYDQRLVAGAAPGACYGIFADFEEARAAIPKNRVVGYDQPEMAAMYRERTERVFPADYAAIYWMSRFLPEVRRLFDFGGHIGLHYYSYRRYLEYPAGLAWAICDVPEVVKAGRELAAERHATGLTFTESFDDADGADLLLASGSLQFLPGDFLANGLTKLRTRPRHVLINRTPVHKNKQFVTLHDNTACHPYTVFERGRFIDTLRSFGYELVDEWDVAELHFEVPCYADYEVPAYSGFYFRKAS
ncbi:MAG TPA: TIGR04325 family methyltransferase [Polyangiaceae bacterium]|nr:TIGR04325 family methyltransferase [Polyangiaceae bacterium]